MIELLVLIDDCFVFVGVTAAMLCESETVGKISVVAGWVVFSSLLF
jgi:hypothetical protein